MGSIAEYLGEFNSRLALTDRLGCARCCGLVLVAPEMFANPLGWFGGSLNAWRDSLQALQVGHLSPKLRIVPVNRSIVTSPKYGAKRL